LFPANFVGELTAAVPAPADAAAKDKMPTRTNSAARWKEKKIRKSRSIAPFSVSLFLWLVGCALRTRVKNAASSHESAD
jgi:hypothetical protein